LTGNKPGRTIPPVDNARIHNGGKSAITQNIDTGGAAAAATAAWRSAAAISACDGAGIYNI
jgi:hypothetical protein